LYVHMVCSADGMNPWMIDPLSRPSAMCLEISMDVLALTRLWSHTLYLILELKT
jgi:hypothetical protein